jgi:hypothetical protein
VNRDEAKLALLLYRPDTRDAEDPEVVKAMELARQDPELGRWFEHHVEFQRAMRRQLRQIEAPAHLKASLLAGQAVAPPAAGRWRLAPLWLAAAAIAVVLAGLGVFWLRPAAQTNQFARFQERMVGQAIRQYEMDWETGDLAQLRSQTASRGGPSDYEVPPGLKALKLTGGGVLRWQSHPVSMACFDRGGGRMLFLFVMKRTALKDPPAPSPRLARVHDWMTASWSRGDNAYLLTGSGERDPEAFLKKYL